MKYKVLVLSLFVFLSGCTTLTKLDNSPSSLTSKLQEGDKVQIDTKDGRSIEFKVKDITGTSISGENVKVLLDDVDTIKRKKVDGAKTAIVGVAGYLTVVMVMIVVTVFSIF